MEYVYDDLDDTWVILVDRDVVLKRFDTEARAAEYIQKRLEGAD